MVDLQENHTGKYLFKVFKKSLEDFNIYHHIQRLVKSNFTIINTNMFLVLQEIMPLIILF